LIPRVLVFLAFPILSIFILIILTPLIIMAWRRLGSRHGWGIIIGLVVVWWLCLISYTIWALLLIVLKSVFHFVA
jgi:hypothetical protein